VLYLPGRIGGTEKTYVHAKFRKDVEAADAAAAY
jgi:hypothetical protein